MADQEGRHGWLLEMKEEGSKIKEREGKRGCIYKGELIIITSLPLPILTLKRLASPLKWAASPFMKSASGKREPDAEMGFASRRKTRVLR